MRVLVCLAVSAAFAQTDLVIKTETRIVPVEVIVKDSHGGPVENLNRDDFTVLDNGKPREFQTFNHERADAVPGQTESAAAVRPANVFTNRILPAGSDHHVTVVLLDGSRDAGTYLRNVPELLKLVHSVKPGEPIAIYTATPRLRVIQDFTTNQDLLTRRIVRFASPVQNQKVTAPSDFAKDAPAVMKTTPRESALRAVGNEYDLQEAMRQLAAHLSTLPGRKSLIWMTETRQVRYMSEWRSAWDGILEQFNAANIAINPIDSGGVMSTAFVEARSGVLADFARRTGGQLYYQGNDIGGAIAQAISERHSTYTLGFYLRDDERDKVLHKLTVKVNRPGIELQHRQGYIPDSDYRLQAIAETSAHTNDILKDPLDLSEIPFTVTIDKSAAGKLAFHINVEPQALRVVSKGAGASARIDQQFFQMDEDGGVYAKISSTKTVEIKPATRVVFDTKGPVWKEEMQVAAKATMLRVILRDPETKRIGSLTIPLN